jgi:heterotetrameric sarcosine oxidase gamma subunit
VPSLIAKSPLSGHSGMTLAGMSLSEAPLASMQSVSPIKGQEKSLAKALKAIGLSMPKPNTCVTNGDVVIVWTGKDQAFLVAPEAVALDGAAVTDQSDGWARLRLEGTAAADVLMRLVPLDLRGVFPGWASRAPLNHMQSILMCHTAGQIDMLVFRSMAQTAWHEVTGAMQTVAARAARPI